MRIPGPGEARGRRLTPEERARLQREQEYQQGLRDLVRDLRDQAEHQVVVEHHDRELLEGVFYGTDRVGRTTQVTELPTVPGQGLRAGDGILVQQQVVQPHREHLAERVDLCSGASVESDLRERSVTIRLPDGSSLTLPETGLELPGHWQANLVLRQYRDHGVTQEVSPDGTIFVIDRAHGVLGNSTDRRDDPPELEGLRSKNWCVAHNTYMLAPDGTVTGFEFTRTGEKGHMFRPGWEPGRIEYVRVEARLGADGKIHVDHPGREAGEIPLLLPPDPVRAPGEVSRETREGYAHPGHQDVLLQSGGSTSRRGIQLEAQVVRVGGVTLKRRTAGT